jgi:hypothetical protein
VGLLVVFPSLLALHRSAPARPAVTPITPKTVTAVTFRAVVGERFVALRPVPGGAYRANRGRLNAIYPISPGAPTPENRH